MAGEPSPTGYSNTGREQAAPWLRPLSPCARQIPCGVRQARRTQKQPAQPSSPPRHPTRLPAVVISLPPPNLYQQPHVNPRLPQPPARIARLSLAPPTHACITTFSAGPRHDCWCNQWARPHSARESPRRHARDDVSGRRRAGASLPQKSTSSYEPAGREGSLLPRLIRRRSCRWCGAALGVSRRVARGLQRTR
jgi:hypothetical protein